MDIGINILDLVGNTPLLRLNRLHSAGNLYAKAEWYNPGGSVKDRPAYQMIKKAIESGELTHDKVLLDATSGNTGIAYAMICSVLGYQAKLCVPANISQARKTILSSYGAELVLTNPLKGSDGAIREARLIYEKDPDHYCYPDQYSNDQNWKAHFETTGPEIWEQTHHQVTHFVAGLGTSGTFVGTGRYLKSVNSGVQVIEVQPDSPMHGLEGWKHMESSIVPRFYDPDLADVKMTASTESAYRIVRKLGKKEGLLVGISCGGALGAALTVAQENPEGIVVTILPDNADKYLEDHFWKD